MVESRNVGSSLRALLQISNYENTSTSEPRFPQTSDGGMTLDVARIFICKHFGK